MTSRLLGLPVAVVALAAFTGTAAGPAVAARGHASCGYRATFFAPGHHPRANKNWVVRVSVRPRNLRTKMHYEFYFSGRRVATRYVLNRKNYSFVNHMSDAVVWPKRSIGIPLVFRIVLRNRCGTKNWDYAVKVRR
jgi:hypothetical protein